MFKNTNTREVLIPEIGTMSVPSKWPLLMHELGKYNLTSNSHRVAIGVQGIVMPAPVPIDVNEVYSTYSSSFDEHIMDSFTGNVETLFGGDVLHMVAILCKGASHIHIFMFATHTQLVSIDVYATKKKELEEALNVVKSLKLIEEILPIDNKLIMVKSDAPKPKFNNPNLQQISGGKAVGIPGIGSFVLCGNWKHKSMGMLNMWDSPSGCHVSIDAIPIDSRAIERYKCSDPIQLTEAFVKDDNEYASKYGVKSEILPWINLGDHKAMHVVTGDILDHSPAEMYVYATDKLIVVVDAGWPKYDTASKNLALSVLKTFVPEQ